jgi:aminomethyltransferase
MENGAPVFAGDRQVGIVTCAMVSTITEKSMAIARLAPDCAIQGTALFVQNQAERLEALAHTLPFDDPKKTKRTAIG